MGTCVSGPLWFFMVPEPTKEPCPPRNSQASRLAPLFSPPLPSHPHPHPSNLPFAYHPHLGANSFCLNCSRLLNLLSFANQPLFLSDPTMK